jgi:hypothetical protein
MSYERALSVDLRSLRMLSIVFIGAYIWREERLKTSIELQYMNMKNLRPSE